MGGHKANQTGASEVLFSSLAQQVKLPFVQIAHAAELLQTGRGNTELIDTISLTSQAALNLIDGYLLSVRLQQEHSLLLEPVALSSVMYDTAHTLDVYAKAHDCDVELNFNGKYGPVMGRREIIEAALTALGYSFIEASSAGTGRNRISLVLRRTAHGLNAGIYSANGALSSALFKHAKALQGLVRQPLGDFSAGAGAGVFVADSLFSSLDSPMKVARFRAEKGLGATLMPSRQLSIV